MLNNFRKHGLSFHHGKLLSQLFTCFLILFCTIEVASARKVSRVIVDAGHGGRDSGAARGSTHEKDLALKVALKVEKLLKNRGMPVTMTRRSDKFVSLNGRAEIANRYKSAIFVSIHFNASRSNRLTGVETYYYGGEGQKLAAHVHLRMLSALSPRDGKTRKRQDLAVLNKTKCPAILVECGYISNYSERVKCRTSSYQEKCAKAIVDGIFAYKGFK